MEPYSSRREPRQLQVLNNLIVPFAPSAAWYAAWWQARRKGLTDAESISAANIATSIRGKDYARCRIMANGNEIILSMAIEGGAARLKRSSLIPSAQLSDHGNWRHVHLGALEAAYGRCPFYQHLTPLIRDIYNSQEHTLPGFNAKIHHAVCSFLNIINPKNIPDIISYTGSSATKERGTEIVIGLQRELSIIDTLMKLGTESILAFDIL